MLEQAVPTVTTLDPTLVAIGIAGAIVTVVGALGGMVVQIINASSASRDRREAALERRILLEKTNAAAKVSDETAAKADTLLQKTVEIHTLTNGTNSELTSALKVANQKIEGLRELMAGFIRSKDEADAARVTTARDVADALATPVPRPSGQTRASDEEPLEVKVVNQPLAVVATEKPPKP